jgi:hypothetical protein
MVYFYTKNPNLDKYWEGLRMENVCIHILCPFKICICILWSFGNFVVIWYVNVSPFWYFVSRKIWQPWLETELMKNKNSANFDTIISFKIILKII